MASAMRWAGSTVMILSAAACTVRRPSAAPSNATEAMVRVSKVSVRGAAIAGDSLRQAILIYAKGEARIALGSGELVPLRDTLRLQHFPTFRADVSKGEIHLQTEAPAQLEVGAEVTGGPATHVGGTGSHLVFLRGGEGILVVR